MNEKEKEKEKGGANNLQVNEECVLSWTANVLDHLLQKYGRKDFKGAKLNIFQKQKLKFKKLPIPTLFGAVPSFSHCRDKEKLMRTRRMTN